MFGLAVGEGRLRVLLHLAQIEEELALVLRGGELDDSPVADDVFLNFRTDPVHGKGHQASAAVRIVVTDGLHEADVAFLNEVRIGQAVSEKASGDRDDQAEMAENEPLGGLHVTVVAKTDGQGPFLLGRQDRSTLGCAHEGFEVSERTDERRYGGCLVCDEGCAFGFLSHLWVSRSRKFGKDCMVAPIGAPNPEKTVCPVSRNRVSGGPFAKRPEPKEGR